MWLNICRRILVVLDEICRGWGLLFQASAKILAFML
jgi:hypothetical protein